MGHASRGRELVRNAGRRAAAVAVGLAAAALFTTPALAQSTRAQRIETYMESFHDLELFQGVALVVDGGQTILLQGFGYSDIRQHLELAVEDRFPVAPLAGDDDSLPGEGRGATPTVRGHVLGLEGLEPVASSWAPGTVGMTARELLDRVRSRWLQASGADSPADSPADTAFHVDTLVIGRDSAVVVVDRAGRLPGAAWAVRLFPGRGRAIALVDNAASELTPLVEGLTRILWGTQARSPKPSIARRLFPIVRSAGVDAALERFESWRMSRSDAYDFGPGELPRIADRLLAEGDSASAFRVLEAEVAAFPAEPPARLALADLALARGDRARAIVELDSALLARPGDPVSLERMLEIGYEPPAALRTPIVSDPPPDLDRFAGRYRVDPGTVLEVRTRDGGLVARRGPESAFRLLPQGGNVFLLEGSAIQFVFESAGERTTAVSILESGQRVTFPRIDSPLP